MAIGGLACELVVVGWFISMVSISLSCFTGRCCKFRNGRLSNDVRILLPLYIRECGLLTGNGTPPTIRCDTLGLNDDVGPCSDWRADGPSLSPEANQFHHHYTATAIIPHEHLSSFAAYSILTIDSRRTVSFPYMVTNRPQPDISRHHLMSVPLHSFRAASKSSRVSFLRPGPSGAEIFCSGPM